LKSDATTFRVPSTTGTISCRVTIFKVRSSSNRWTPPSWSCPVSTSESMSTSTFGSRVILMSETTRSVNPILVEIVGNQLLSVAEEMGATLVRAAYSTNIKERKDCSTAVFNARGEMIAQAEHIPMHLGSL